jgi:hypothetical protein
MAYANGRVPRSALRRAYKFNNGTYALLATTTARDFKRLKAAAKKQLGRNIGIPAPAGAYRSYATQASMHHAGSKDGTYADRVRWGLNPNSVVAIASAGYSTHGLGKSVDIIGTPMDDKFLALAKKYGFTRTFGSRDPNHFGHA